MRFQEKRFSVATTTADAKPEECPHTTVIRVRERPRSHPDTLVSIIGECWHCKSTLLQLDTGWVRL